MKKIKFKISNLNNIIINFFNNVFQSINYKYKKLAKISNLNNIIINFFNNVFQSNNYTYKKLAKISNFNKSLIFIISLLFLYLFYLSIPSLYDKGKLEKDLTNKLKSEFKINFSISSEINYSILPAPHIRIKNVKIFNDKSANLNELAQIKDLKIFISQKNLFNQDQLEIKKIIINHANFSIKRNDFNFINNFINQKFSTKKIFIKNSNIFYKDLDDETVSISKVSNLNFFLNIKKTLNEIKVNGKIYQVPFTLKWSRDFKKNSSKKTIIEMNKLNLKFFNNSVMKNFKYTADSKLIIGGSTLIFNYNIKDNIIILKSNNSKLLNNNIKYDGSIQTNPFDLILNIDSKKFDYNKYIITNNFLQEILKTNLLFNKNLNAKISFNANNILTNKLFDSLKILLNLNNGNINFNQSYLSGSKIGKLNLDYGKIYKEDNQLVLKTKFNFNIENEAQFFRSFQIPKNNRLNLKNIYFDLEYNLFDKEFKITSFKLNDLNIKKNDIISNVLDDFNKKNEIKNWIDLKNFINKIFLAYKE